MLASFMIFAAACSSEGGEAGGSGPSGDSFVCDDGASIPISRVCDGGNDCPGAEDEAGCVTDAGEVESVEDGSPDAIADTNGDLQDDTEADTSPDTLSDASPDTLSDTSPDTLSDAAPDTLSDTSPDTLSDATESSAECPADLPAPGDGFVRLAAGTFTMGSPPTELRRGPDETQHEVTLTRDFWMQSTEVTQRAWVSLMGSNPSCFQTTTGDINNPGCTSADANPNGPVEQVSWFDAIAYANARSRAEGLPECYDVSGNVIGGATVYECCGYRLPTEAEWEYAARAGTTTATYQGDLSGEPFSCASQPNLDPIAWFCANAGNRTRAVGTLIANEWGLNDMLGNVWEWTSDWYGEYSGDVVDPAGPASGSSRVNRGGSWDTYANFTRAGMRGNGGPDSRGSRRGFRLARSAP